MADEISSSTSFQLNVGSVRLTRETSKLITQSTPRYFANVQAIGTAYEQVTVPADIATPGVGVFVNTDATNYVEIGVEVAAAFYPLVKLKAGESAQLRLATATFFARANTSAVNLELVVAAD